MSTSTLSSKGQITLPAEVRRALRLDVGDRVEFVQTAPDRFELVAATGSVRALRGMFGKPVRKVSVQDMNAAIARAGAAARE